MVYVYVLQLDAKWKVMEHCKGASLFGFYMYVTSMFTLLYFNMKLQSASNMKYFDATKNCIYT